MSAGRGRGCLASAAAAVALEGTQVPGGHALKPARGSGAVQRRHRRDANSQDKVATLPHGPTRIREHRNQPS